jgi:hypothetical protein
MKQDGPMGREPSVSTNAPPQLLKNRLQRSGFDNMIFVEHDEDSKMTIQQIELKRRASFPNLRSRASCPKTDDSGRENSMVGELLVSLIFDVLCSQDFGQDY